MKRLLLLFLFLSFRAEAQSLTIDPCIWSGDYAKCLPQFGLFLNNGRGLQLGPDTDDLHYVELKANAAQTTNYSLAFPATNGSVNQSLLYDGAGGFNWYTPFTSTAFTTYIEALPMKYSAQAASTANINMGAGNPGTVDGVDCTFGCTLLLKNQTTNSENGLWFVDSGGTWTRDSTFPNNMSSAWSAIVAVNHGGTVNGDTIWYSKADGTGAVPFVEIPTTSLNTPITASRALASTSGSKIIASVTTSNELAFLSGVTSAVQTQLDSKITSPFLAQGDLLYANASVAPARLAKAGATTVLHSGNTPSWSAVTLTTDVTGVLPTANGGTGQNSTATFPTSGVVVTEAGTETLTNKTLTSPTLTTPTLGAATATSITFSPTTGGIVGTTTNDSAGSGKVGEFIEAYQNTASVGTSAQYWDAATMTLSAGDWDVQGSIEFFRNGATISNPDIEIGIGSASGNSATGLVGGRNLLFDVGTTVPTDFSDRQMKIGPIRVQSDGTNLYIAGTTFSSTQVVRLKGYISTYSVATPNIQAYISARRVR